MTAVYLTANQVAERLQVSVSWVYKHKHLLGGIRVGTRLWRFPEQQLTAQFGSPLDTARRDARQAAKQAPAAREWRLTY